MAKHEQKAEQHQHDHQQQHQQKRSGGSGRYALYGVAGIGLLAAAGVAYFVYREKSVEKPPHKVLERDGQFEVREYPELLVAETKVAGERDYALDHGFSQLADYVFARSGGNQRVGMTAPVLSAGAEDGAWVTRFVMPAGSTRESLPEPGEDIRLTTLPARKVAVMRFSGTGDEAALADHEQQLKHWVGAKKLNPAGAPERAFYNSPVIPPPLRRTEILLPVT